MLLDLGKASYLEKALQQPEKVKMVLDKLRSDPHFNFDSFDDVDSLIAACRDLKREDILETR